MAAFRAAPLPLEELKDSNTAVRVLAAARLGVFGNEQAIEPLLAALGDEDKAVRNQVIMALGMLRSEAAVEPFLQVLTSPTKDAITRQTAILALTRIGNRRATPVLLDILTSNPAQTEEDLVGVLNAPGQLGDPITYNVVLEYTTGNQPSVTYAAIRALGIVGRETSHPTREATLEFLVDLLRNHPDE